MLSSHSITEYSFPVNFNTASQVVPQSRPSAAGFSLRGPGFDTTAVLVWVKAIPLQSWTVRKDSRRLMLPDFKIIGIWR